MTDAAHLLVDFLSFIISLLSLWLSSRPATHKLNYGWHRAGTALTSSHLSSLEPFLCLISSFDLQCVSNPNPPAEILGALLSVFTIWVVTGVLVYLAVERLISNDYTIEGTIMLITSACAVLANIM